MMKFSKYHALGNDYVVVDASEFSQVDQQMAVRLVCAQHFGLGADGVLVREADNADGSFQVRIFNSDASEAEKSGNGLRIFARYLFDKKAVATETFKVITRGGPVTCQVSDEGRTVSVDMGQITFDSHDIPVTGPPREVIDESIKVNGSRFRFSAASIGNPHCVVMCDELDEEVTKTLGPLIETEARFPNMTNVQFLKVLDRSNLRIQIWERGVGYTLASGTSSCAAAAVARKLDLCDVDVTVHMPGGQLSIALTEDFEVRMTGPVVRVAEGTICGEILDDAFLEASTMLDTSVRS